MNRRVAIGGRIVLALSAAVFLAGSAVGQSDPSSYPYWASAPGGYGGSNVTVPVPGPSSSNISNAARSTSYFPGSMNLGSGLGGMFLPPSLTARDTGSRLPGSDQENRAHIWLRVPDNAEVWVDGVKTRQSGELRHFFSPPLKPGQRYAYNMRIRWKENGKALEKTQRILVSAGLTVRRQVPPSVGDEKSSPADGGTAKK